MTQHALESNGSHTKTSTPHLQKIDISPKLPGFFAFFVLFGLPGFITGLVWLLITFILLISIIVGLAGPTDPATSALDYTIVQNNNKTKDAILIYDLTGPIDSGASTVTDTARLTSISTELVKRDFARIKADKSIKNVVFRVNTPGGSVFAAKVLGDQINDLILSKGQTQAVFYFDQIVASGGLWASYKNNNYVVGSPYGETGSIGVILSLPNYAGLADKVGYSETVIKSAPSKDIGNPLRPVSTEEKTYLQNQVDQTYNDFIDVIATGRKIDRAKVQSIANGYVYNNDKALEYGLLDELGQVDTAIRKAAGNASISDYNIYEVKTTSSFSSLFATTLFPSLDSLNKAADSLNPSSILQPGTVYAIDTTRIK